MREILAVELVLSEKDNPERQVISHLLLCVQDMRIGKE